MVVKCVFLPFFFVDVFSLFFAVFFFLQDQLGKAICKLENAVVKEMLDRVYLVVDCSVLFMYGQFLSSFDHSVMLWLNSGLNQKLLPLSVIIIPSAASLHEQLFEL